MKNLVDLDIVVMRTADDESKALQRLNISYDEAMALINKYHKRAYIRNVHVFGYTLYIWGKDGKVRKLVDHTCYPSNAEL